MPQLDYHKIVGIIARTLESEADLSVQKNKDQLELFNVNFRDRNGMERSFVMHNGHFNIELKVNRSQFEEKQFERWIKVFEYELEQAFLTNIKVTVDVDPGQYRIVVSS